MKIDYEFVDAKDCFDDDNNGYIYGIHWADENGNILECEWFKTEQERSNSFNKTMKRNKNYKG